MSKAKKSTETEIAKKKTKAQEEEEEWEDVDEEEQEGAAGDEEEEEEVDESICNPDVNNKYKRAAQWSTDALKFCITKCKDGANIVQVCKETDNYIDDKVKTMFKGLEYGKGVGFPTTLSVNSCVAYQSDVPGEGDGANRTLKTGDVIHIDLAVHVDGFIAPIAYTYHLTESGDLNPESKEAQIMAAAYATLDAAVRQLRPENEETGQPKTLCYDVTKVIEGCADHFGYASCDGVLSHQMVRQVMDSHVTIASNSKPELKVHDYDVGANTVWAIDVVFSTGKGKFKEGDDRCGIFRQAFENEHTPRLDSARNLVHEVDNEHAEFFPFALRSVKTQKARVGLTELLKHNVFRKYPPIYEKPGEIVAQYKITVLVSDKKIDRVNGIPLQKGAAAVKPFAEGSELAVAAKKPFTLEAKKSKPAAASAASASEAKK